MAKADDDLFDLDAIENDAQPFAWQFGGETFAFPGDPPATALEFIAKGDLQMSLYVLLGEDDYNRLDGLEAPLTMGKYQALIERYFKHLGLDLGKSSRSSKSARLPRSARALR